MKLKSYLASTSVAAILFAGSAHAQVSVAIGNSDRTTLPPAAANNVGNRIESAFNLPTEVDFAQSPDNALKGNFEFNVNTALNIAGGVNVLLRVNLTGPAEFTTALTPAAIAAGNDGKNSGTGFVLNDGDEGDSTVEFLYEVDSSAENSIGLVLPVSITGCGSVSLDVDLRTEFGNAIQGQFASLTNAFVTCGGNAFELAFASDEDEVDSDTFVENIEGYTELAEWDRVSNSLNTGGLLVSRLGESEGDINLLGPAPLSYPNAVGLAVNGNSITVPASTQITEVAFSVQYQDASAMLADNTVPVHTALLYTPTSTAVKTGNNVAIKATAAAEILAIFSGDEDIFTEVSGTDLVARQPVSASAAAVKFVVTADQTVALNPNQTYAGAPLDGLEYNGIACGPFNWFADGLGNGSINHIVRVTGLPAGTIGYAAELRNSSGRPGVPATNGVWFGSATATGGDVLINSNNIRNLVGAGFGRADLMLHFFADDDNDYIGLGVRGFNIGAQCNRLLGMAGGQVTDYGDTMNWNPVHENGETPMPVRPTDEPAPDNN